MEQHNPFDAEKVSKWSTMDTTITMPREKIILPLSLLYICNTGADQVLVRTRAVIHTIIVLVLYNSL